MTVSVDASLRKLRTSYIDILYVHWWDFATPVEEVVNGLHNVVAQGKVLYLVSSLESLCLFFVMIAFCVGGVRCPCLGSCESKYLRKAHRENSVCYLSRTLERYVS